MADDARPADDSPLRSRGGPTPFAARLAKFSSAPASDRATPSLGSWRDRLSRETKPVGESVAAPARDESSASVVAALPSPEPTPISAPATIVDAPPVTPAKVNRPARGRPRHQPSLTAATSASPLAPDPILPIAAAPELAASPAVEESSQEVATPEDVESSTAVEGAVAEVGVEDAKSTTDSKPDDAATPDDARADCDANSKRVFNWGFILPRVAALAGLALALTIFASPIVAFGVRAVGERIVRAKVDLGATNASWIDARVELKNVAVANRRRPGKNLFEFESGTLDFDAFKLLNGQYVVDEASLSGLRFDTDRGDDGRSNFVRLRDLEIPLPHIDLKDLGLDRLKKSLAKFSLKGVAALQERLEQEVLKTELESLVVLQKAKRFWTDEYVAWQGRVRAVKDRVDEVKRVIDAAKRSPLADRFVAYQAAARDLVGVLEELQAAQVRVAELPGFVKRDLTAVVEAAQRDAVRIRDRLKAPFVEATHLADALLGPEMQQRMDHVAAGIRFVRELAAPLEDESLEPPPTYGRNFEFPLDEALPRCLVRKLTVDGVVVLAGTPTKFAGSIENLNTCPRKLGRPTLARLTLDGPARVEMDATIDRTTPTRRDSLKITATKIKTSAKTLGDPDDFAVTLCAGEASLELDVVLEDDRLDAKFVWTQPACRVAMTMGDLGEKPWAAGLCGKETPCGDFVATITATGPLSSPEWKLATNLGDAVHPHLQGMFESRMADVRDHLCRQIEALAQRQLGDLEATLEKERQAMLDRLTNGSGVIAEFRDSAAREFPQLQLASLEKLKSAGVDFARMKQLELQANAAGAMQEQTDAARRRAAEALQAKLPTDVRLPNVPFPGGALAPAGAGLPGALGPAASLTPAINNNPVGANPLGASPPRLPDGFNPAALVPGASGPNGAPVAAPPNFPLEAKRFFR